MQIGLLLVFVTNIGTGNRWRGGRPAKQTNKQTNELTNERTDKRKGGRLRVTSTSILSNFTLKYEDG